MNYVVGSGPSGFIAAKALLEAGAPVTILDVGAECEPERAAEVRSLAALDVERWPSAAVDRIRGPATWDPTLPKLCYGSTFPYALDELEAVRQEGTKCLLSFARGGLSNVWGAAVLPNRPDDFADWPVSFDQMVPHYRAVADVLGVAGAHDELEALFPFYADPLPAPRLSRQGALMLETLRRHDAALRTAGIRFGQARLAMRTRDDESGRQCQNATLCLSGCPYGALWNAADALVALRRREPRLMYEVGRRVERVRRDGDEVVLTMRRLDTGDVEERRGRRAFIACGTVATTLLMLDSLGLYDHPLSMQFQPYFLLPLLALKDVPNVETERLHTLAQVYLELMDPAVSKHVVHLQVYTYNTLMREHLSAASRFAPKMLTERLFLGRLLAIQGYFHSSEVDGITVSAQADASRGRARLSLRAPSPERAKHLAQGVVSKLTAHSRQLGAMPLKPAIRYGQPGEGNHIGGVFPMRAQPRRLETDVLGQLPELPGVHLVDAAVMTSLAATTFSYTMMANAHRIATTVAREGHA
jgi:choline dehydrogenase-like flavoprotein